MYDALGEKEGCVYLARRRRGTTVVHSYACECASSLSFIAGTATFLPITVAIMLSRLHRYNVQAGIPTASVVYVCTALRQRVGPWGSSY